jgi:type IV pilus assembly protein PilA
MKKIKSFTLIELLVVVAIIGILAAVGTPIFQGFMLDAKINATKENHNRIVSIVSASFTKCAINPTGSIKIKWSSRGSIIDYNVSCTQPINQFAAFFQGHFNYSGYKNPYDTSKGCCYQGGSSPDIGFNAIHFEGNQIRILTNYQSGSSNLKTLILKE